MNMMAYVWWWVRLSPKLKMPWLPLEGLRLVMDGSEPQIKNALATSIKLMFGDMGVLV